MDKIKALIADDVKELRQLLKRQISRYNCEVVKEIAEGNLVIEAIRKTAPDIVFLDINMPGKNGLDILKELSEKNIHNKVWIISADDDKETIERARDFGAMGYITKPFSVQELEQTFQLYREFSVKKQENIDNSPSIEVFVVDDEILMQKLLEKILVKCHCKIVKTLSSGNELIAAISESTLPEILFLDIEMPNGSGLDVLQHFRENTISVFTVMVSAHGTFENVKTAMDAGADGFIVKPYTTAKIEQIIRKYKKSVNEN